MLSLLGDRSMIIIRLLRAITCWMDDARNYEYEVDVFLNWEMLPEGLSGRSVRFGEVVKQMLWQIFGVN